MEVFFALLVILPIAIPAAVIIGGLAINKYRKIQEAKYTKVK